MKSYLERILRAAESTRELCSNAIEEINDGGARGQIVLSLMEAVYDYQGAVRGYMTKYYNYFGKEWPEYDEKLTRRARKFLQYCPGEQLREKHSRRTEGRTEL